MRNVKVGRTATPFRILGDEREPVQDVFIEDVTIDAVRGERNRYENVKNVKESDIRIGTFLEEPDKENKNR